MQYGKLAGYVKTVVRKRESVTFALNERASLRVAVGHAFI